MPPKGSWLSQLPKTSPGFTLVELVVVIAIMAILAGVGTVAYSGYIKHANKELDRTMVGHIQQAIDTGAYAHDLSGEGQLPGEGLKAPVGYIVLKNDTAEVFGLDLTAADGADSVEEGGPLEAVMSDAFGTDWKTNARLKYDGWSAENIASSIPSVYLSGSDVIEAMADMINESGWSVMILPKVPEGANKVVTQLSRDEFIDCWNTISTSEENDTIWKDNGANNFGITGNSLDTTTKAARIAATGMYNAGFTTWMTQNADRTEEEHISIPTYLAGQYVEGYAPDTDGTGDCDSLADHVAAITKWGDAVKTGITFSNLFSDPRTICRSAFTDASDLPIKNCPACKDLYEQYVSSGAYKNNAGVIYDTLKTVADTGKSVLDECKNDSDDFFGYYMNYMEKFEEMYGKVKDLVAGEESCIVIAVSPTAGGTMACEVYPGDADPRNS